MSAIPEPLRRQTAARAGQRCAYCHLPQRGQVAPFLVDHVVPRTAGGATDTDNLALACPHCNGHKWAHSEGIDPGSGKLVPLFNPRTQAWADHFRWSGRDANVLEGTTATGRATVIRLQMNHADMIVVRRMLRALEVPLD